jgi:hypothetical protein
MKPVLESMAAAQDMTIPQVVTIPEIIQRAPYFLRAI